MSPRQLPLGHNRLKWFALVVVPFIWSAWKPGCGEGEERGVLGGIFFGKSSKSLNTISPASRHRIIPGPLWPVGKLESGVFFFILHFSVRNGQFGNLRRLRCSGRSTVRWVPAGVLLWQGPPAAALEGAPPEGMSVLPGELGGGGNGLRNFHGEEFWG